MGRQNRISLEYLYWNRWLWIVEQVGKPIITKVIEVEGYKPPD